ncbi:sensor histidine kinase [Calorimonas adulescens]|uniref:histidine kinase n=2 Tax=Calorimonas adulescens TaxID=2606906 RepID=A0A5D8QCG4_9THEO|nr:sensor histidine kinase [Calorimonas adulescens]
MKLSVKAHEVVHMNVIFIEMVNRLGTIVTVAFILSRLDLFKRIILGRDINRVSKILMTVIFGAFGILGTYTGVPINGALANSRAVGVIIAGLLGGPWVGLGAGVISGLHRWAIDIGGFTAFACAVSTIAEGFVSGMLSKGYANAKNSFVSAFLIGALCETMQMGIILLLARPFSEALGLVRIIWIPMSMINAAGIAIFMMILDIIYKEQERLKAGQAQLAMDIAEKTLPYFRGEFDSDSAYNVAKIIYEMTDLDAVAFTDRDKILAHVGCGSDHHVAGDPVRTSLTREVLRTGEIKVAVHKEGIECSHGGCPLRSAVVSPLYKKDQMIGVLKLYRKRENAITETDINLAKGLAGLISTQLELTELELQNKLLEEARFKALQAQINPHFLFNSINTIISVSRMDPEKSRKLLLDLATFFRRNLEIDKAKIPLSKELEHVRAFVAIEEARFGDRIKVEINADDVDGIFLPPLTLQPLVENAIKHGLLPKDDGGRVRIDVIRRGMYAEIKVEDNGMGMDETFDTRTPNPEHVGLYNVDSRLRSMFGDGCGIHIASTKGKGTTISFEVPCQEVVQFESIAG